MALGRRIVEAIGGDIHTEANAGAGETLVFEFSAPHAVEISGEPAGEVDAPQRAAQSHSGGYRHVQEDPDRQSR